MTVPRHPDSYPYASRKPGIIPLRPLATGEILGAGVQVVRRHFLPLAAASLVFSVLGSLATWGVLAATDQLDLYISGAWVDRVLDGTTTSLPLGVIAATFLGLLVSTGGGLLISGLAAICAAQDTLGRPTSREQWRKRLAGRWPVLIGASLLVGVAMSVGFMLFIVPGVLIYLAWMVVGPVVAMERAAVGTALNRSSTLTRGDRGRLFGVVVAVLALSLVATMLVSVLIGPMLVNTSDLTALVVAEVVGAAIGVFTSSWAGAVSAIAYIDLRIRKENLAPTLAAAAGQQ